MSVLYQLPSEPRIRIEVLVVTEQRVPDAADGATRTFDGGSKTIANSLADETGATLLVAALSDVGGALDSCVRLQVECLIAVHMRFSRHLLPW